VDGDEALTRAWPLLVENATDEVMDELETLIPMLVEAGYAEADEHTWRTTPAAHARAAELGLDASSDWPTADGRLSRSDQKATLLRGTA
jgi:hypothetical protein